MIDNIFIKVIDGKIKSGLLVTDVSDYLPVFTVLEINNKSKFRTKKQNNLIRIKSPEAIIAFKTELLNYDWQEVYVDYINESYEAFF